MCVLNPIKVCPPLVSTILSQLTQWSAYGIKSMQQRRLERTPDLELILTNCGFSLVLWFYRNDPNMWTMLTLVSISNWTTWIVVVHIHLQKTVDWNSKNTVQLSSNIPHFPWELSTLSTVVMNIEIFLLLKDAGSRNKEKQRKIEGLRPREGSRGVFFLSH